MLPVDPSRYALYLGVMAAMAVTPGPANLFAIATGMERGGRAALIGVAGMNAAMAVWYLAAGLGLSALILAAPEAFRYVAIAGGLYVAWLGAKALYAAWVGQSSLGRGRAADAGAAFRDGFAVQISNPKALLFFTAVLPPFIDPARPIVPQLAMFAAATLTLDAIAMSAYGVAGGALSAKMSDQRFRRAFSFIVGALLISAAALILFRR
ncbi:MAG: LysE family translocator [Hyphomonadaceae bacterium]